jgi:hypothetical protein
MIIIEKLEDRNKNRYQNYLNGRVCVPADSTVLVKEGTDLPLPPRHWKGWALKINPPLPTALEMDLPASK